MALQRYGAVNMEALIAEMDTWSLGSWLEKRAAIAALCEPALLRDRAHVEKVLAILDGVTASLVAGEDRRSDAFRALRQGLGYCWSVAVVAAPEPGRPLMERWFATDDRDVLWVMKDNLRKKRLAQMDAAWVRTWQERLGMVGA